VSDIAAIDISSLVAMLSPHAINTNYFKSCYFSVLNADVFLVDINHSHNLNAQQLFWIISLSDVYTIDIYAFTLIIYFSYTAITIYEEHTLHTEFLTQNSRSDQLVSQLFLSTLRLCSVGLSLNIIVLSIRL